MQSVIVDSIRTRPILRLFHEHTLAKRTYGGLLPQKRSLFLLTDGEKLHQIRIISTVLWMVYFKNAFLVANCVADVLGISPYR